MHLNLATRDLGASVAFYSTAAGRPAREDRCPTTPYSSPNNPGSNSPSIWTPAPRPHAGQHFGIVVDSSEVVDAQIARLQSSGYTVEVEREETCCYANPNESLGE